MAYLLDSDVLIRAKNDHYGLDFCPGFWDWVVETSNVGGLYSIEAFHDELAAGEDDLAEWVKGHRQIFLPFSGSDLTSVAAVNRWAADSSDYEATAKVEFASAADSFLVGQALSANHTVVTHERISNGRRKIKIPNAAAVNGVR